MTATSSAGVLRYSPATNTTTGNFPFPTAPFPRTLEVSPDRTRAIALGDSQVGVLNLLSNTISHTLPLAGANSVTHLHYPRRRSHGPRHPHECQRGPRAEPALSSSKAREEGI